MKEVKKSLYASIVLLIFSCIIIFYAIPTQISVSALLGENNTVVDSRFFPYIVSGLIGILSFAELITSIVKLRKMTTKEETKEKESVRGTIIGIVVFGLFVVYLLVFAYFGFIIASLIVPTIVLFVLGSRKWQHYVSYYAVMAATYFIFVYALKISLP